MNEKQRARYLVNKEVATGRMLPARMLICAKCGSMAHHYHHSDYDKPLDVVPLCVTCHGKVHAKLCAGDRSTKPRAMVAVRVSLRDRFNRVGAMLGAIEGRKMSQDDTLVWLLDRYELEINRRMMATSSQEMVR
jgi:hypothetical protein